MSEIKTFFRFCPSCGRRFHIKLMSKKLESTEGHPDSKRALVRTIGTKGRPPGVLLEEKIPMVFEEDGFQYSYKCKHCGHEWTEIQGEARETKAPAGYIGD